MYSALGWIVSPPPLIFMTRTQEGLKAEGAAREACQIVSRSCSYKKHQGRQAAPETPEKLSGLTIDDEGVMLEANGSACTPTAQGTPHNPLHTVTCFNREMRDEITCHRCLELKRSLDKEQTVWAGIANTLQNELVQCQAEADALRDRVAYLEAVHSLNYAPPLRSSSETPWPSQKETEELSLTKLQLEVSELQRQLLMSQRALSALAESEAAAQQRCKVLSHQVEYFVRVLDESLDTASSFPV